MKYIIALLTFLTLLSSNVMSQYDYEPNEKQLFGKLNPAAPPQTANFEPLMGISTCKSQSRAADGSWNKEINMLWKWKYVMNGMAVQDETLKEDGFHSGSIRQFNADSAKWYVHYYASATPLPSLPTWEGAKVTDKKIVLYKEQKAPNGVDGYFRLTFSEISVKSFNWIGEWVNTDETFAFPTWKITCIKKQD